MQSGGDAFEPRVKPARRAVRDWSSRDRLEHRLIALTPDTGGTKLQQCADTSGRLSSVRFVRDRRKGK